MITCPLCKRDADSLCLNPNLSRDALLLALRANPDWNPTEGCCTRCCEAIADAMAEAEKFGKKIEATESKYEDYFRYVLGLNDSLLWHHDNPDVRHRNQNRIMGLATEEAERAGYERWLILDALEEPLAEGAKTSLANDPLP